MVDIPSGRGGIEDPVVFEEQAGTSSRLHPLERPKFGELLTYARPGDAVHISEMFRLLRGTGHIVHREQVALRIHDGTFSAMDLTARHPRTGELLSTVKFMVRTLAAAGELQRDLQRELAYDGLRAAEAKGKKGGRRPAVAADKTDAVRAAYLEGSSIAPLARDPHVSRSAIRTAVADLLPEYTAADLPDVLAPELPVVLDMPGKIADFLSPQDHPAAGSWRIWVMPHCNLAGAHRHFGVGRQHAGFALAETRDPRVLVHGTTVPAKVVRERQQVRPGVDLGLARNPHRAGHREGQVGFCDEAGRQPRPRVPPPPTRSRCPTPRRSRRRGGSRRTASARTAGCPRGRGCGGDGRRRACAGR